MWVAIIPIAVDALGTVPKAFLMGLEQLEIGRIIETIQTIA